MAKNYDNMTPIEFGDNPQSARKSLRAGVALTWNSPVALGLYIVRILYLWQARIDTRCDLKQLSDATLKDIGLSRKQVVKEAAKPFWQE